jgi:hypothetical protein
MTDFARNPDTASPLSHQHELEPHELQAHMVATYFFLRAGMAIMAFALPLLLWCGAAARGVPLQASMSAYYHASNGLMRDEFAGVLVAIGAFLYLYEGFSRAENRALNLAGIFAVGVAMIPMEWNCSKSCARFSR